MCIGPRPLTNSARGWMRRALQVGTAGRVVATKTDNSERKRERALGKAHGVAMIGHEPAGSHRRSPRTFMRCTKRYLWRLPPPQRGIHTLATMAR